MIEMTYEELYKNHNELQINYNKLQINYNNLELELNSLKRMLFGSKRESLKKEEYIVNGVQTSFFDDGKAKEEIEDQIVQKTEEIVVHTKKHPNQKRAGIKESILKDIEIEIKEYRINEDKRCPKCSSEMKEISKELSRQEITYIPAKLVLTNYVQYTYKCVECGNNEDEGATFIKSELPRPLLNHSFASPSLATAVIYKKYFMGVPLYRQEKIWSDMGLILPRNMMANWIIKLTEYYFTNLYNLMHEKLKSECETLHCDETTMQCNKEEGRNATSNSYMWVLRSGELEKHKGVIFKYEKSRSEETAKSFLKGFTGNLVTDGYASYNNIPDVVHSECFSHCRRYFYESVPLDKNKKMDVTSDGYIGVEYCNKLFEIERQIASLSTAEKKERRQKDSKQILEDFFDWVNLTLNEKIVINAKLKKALTYTLNQKKELSEFLNDGRIPLTNNLVERAIRPFAIHRKNWLFADSEAGANANAVIYSLIESAKVNNLNIAKYIEFLLKEIPQLDIANDISILDKYLPWSNELPNTILNP